MKNKNEELENEDEDEDENVEEKIPATLNDTWTGQKIFYMVFSQKDFENMNIDGETSRADARAEIRKNLGLPEPLRGAGVTIGKKALNEAMKNAGYTKEQMIALATEILTKHKEKVEMERKIAEKKKK